MQNTSRHLVQILHFSTLTVCKSLLVFKLFMNLWFMKLCGNDLNTVLHAKKKHANNLFFRRLLFSCNLKKQKDCHKCCIFLVMVLSVFCVKQYRYRCLSIVCSCDHEGLRGVKYMGLGLGLVISSGEILR